MTEQPADTLLAASSDGDEHREAAEAPPPRTAAPGCWKCAAGAAALAAVLAAAGAAAWLSSPATVRRGADELLGPDRQMTESGRAMTAPASPLGGSGSSGAQVEVEFYWLRNITRCVGVDGGLEAAERGAGLVFLGCAEGPLGFLLTSPTDPLLRVAEKPDLCVDSPSNASQLRLWSCSETDDAATNMQFFLQASPGNRTTGSVRALHNSSMCMGGAVDRPGAPVEMHECADTTGDLFMLNLVIERKAEAGADVVAEAEGAAVAAWAQAAGATQSAAGAAQKLAQDSMEASATLWNTTRRTAKNWMVWWH